MDSTNNLVSYLSVPNLTQWMNCSEKSAYVAQEYPSGMEYNLKYPNARYETVRNDWDEWRFTSWTRPGGRNRSGAYM